VERWKLYNNFSELKVDIFGESHSEEIGVILSGIPKDTPISLESIQKFVDRRKSGKGAHSTPRIESDKVEIIEGVEFGKTNGESIKAIIKNNSVRSNDYDNLKYTPRPSHADYVSYIKSDGKANLSGGGRFSGRMTAPLCIAGGIAKDMLKALGVEIGAYIYKVGNITTDSYKNRAITMEEISNVSQNSLPVLNEKARKEIEAKILETKEQNDSIGGSIECIVFNPPIGLGNALFEGLEGRISSAVFAIPAVKAIEFGSGFDLVEMNGSKSNDPFSMNGDKVVTLTNNSGGINGGISNGMNITMRVAFRPTPSISLPQNTVDLKTGEPVQIEIKGRHDSCIVPRAVPCVESAVALVLLDAYLENKRGKDEIRRN
jgi:chorismate synthase